MEDFVAYADIVAHELFDFIYSHSFTVLFCGPTIILTIILAIFFILRIKNKRKDEQILSEFNKKEDENINENSTSPIEKDKEEDDDEDGDSENENENKDSSSLFSYIKKGLEKTRENFTSQIFSLFSKKQILTDETLEKLYTILYRADLGVGVVEQLIKGLKSSTLDQQTDFEEIKTILKQESKKILTESISSTENTETPPSSSPSVILVIGVNGVGKTTTCGKLVNNFISSGKSCILCAADTYRAAAIDQLKVWGERLGVPVVANRAGSDPAAVAYDGVQSSISKKVDYLIVDTAGRLHNKKELMDELSKISRVITKALPQSSIDIWVVIDATTGQNAFRQVEAFKEVAKVSGLIVTKLDGTAKGGVILGICAKYKIPVKYVGVGEKLEDLREFSIDEYVDSLF